MCHLWNNSSSLPRPQWHYFSQSAEFPWAEWAQHLPGKVFFSSPLGSVRTQGNSKPYKLEIVSVCKRDCVCVYECMSDCLYASRRGGGLCFDSIRCTGFNLPTSFTSFSQSCIVHMKTEQGDKERKLFLNNEGRPVCFQDLRTLPLT